MRHLSTSIPGFVAGLMLAVLAATASGCAATESQPAPGAAQGTTPGGTGQQPGTSPSSVAAVAGNPFLIEDGANGKTVTVSVGTQVQLLLHSSYWRVNDSSRPDVLAKVGAPAYIRATPACAPGMGCNPVRVTFRAVRAGTAVLIADRTTCGEALRCPAGKRHFQVTVIVRLGSGRSGTQVALLGRSRGSRTG